ncbi:hypothetical protein [Bosea sp. (in: a-proteobacteria)]|jgi:hypothetical protein|uniref:hypothetical protein n=1 Tax=Bosea sp. (in: a-proteobacteria) TaxID=1871050 RepID=UPI002DDC9AE3|nr:hypothetical protein [Bosea sp. (in: a-proteobacteria)]HEV2509092.1 hypothetical protein [Bosea sp. (in: a-proteobacteria)]
MRIVLAAIAITLAGCSGSDSPRGVARNLTIGTEQCSKFKWGTPEMAACLDRAAEQQSAIVASPKDADSS